MDIKIGKYQLTSDKLQFIVYQRYKPQTGKTKGTIQNIEYTYHISLQSAFEEILRRKTLASKAKSIEALIIFLKKQKAEIQKLFNATLIKEEKNGKLRKSK